MRNKRRAEEITKASLVDRIDDLSDNSETEYEAEFAAISEAEFAATSDAATAGNATDSSDDRGNFNFYAMFESLNRTDGDDRRQRTGQAAGAGAGAGAGAEAESDSDSDSPAEYDSHLSSSQESSDDRRQIAALAAGAGAGAGADSDEESVPLIIGSPEQVQAILGYDILNHPLPQNFQTSGSGSESIIGSSEADGSTTEDVYSISAPEQASESLDAAAESTIAPAAAERHLVQASEAEQPQHIEEEKASDLPAISAALTLRQTPLPTSRSGSPDVPPLATQRIGRSLRSYLTASAAQRSDKGQTDLKHGKILQSKKSILERARTNAALGMF